MRKFLTVLSLHLGATLTSAAMVDSCDYPTDAAAQAKWKVMNPNGVPAKVASDGGRQVLALESNFAGTKLDRGTWDFAFDQPLGEAQAVEFELKCARPQPISGFSAYLNSGQGWHHASFYPTSTSGWNRILITKADTQPDGQPGPWAQSGKLRLSAWRAGDENTVLLVRNLRKVGVLGEDARVLMIESNEEAKKPRESWAVRLSRDLMALGIWHQCTAEDRVEDSMVQKAAVVVLPHNPTLQPRTQQALRALLQRGGKLLSFYSMPRSLADLTHIEPGELRKPAASGEYSRLQISALPGAPKSVPQESWIILTARPMDEKARTIATWLDANGHETGLPAIIESDSAMMMTHVFISNPADGHAALLRAMLGRLDPQIWESSLAAARERLGTIGPWTTLAETLAGLTNTTGAAAASLAKARESLASMEKAAGDKDHAAAIAACAAAESSLRDCFCQAQQAQPGEFRAFWCHNAFGVQGMSWDESVRRLKEAGFTAVVPNLLWGGTAYYPSEVLPVSEKIGEKGDQLAACLDACKKYGLQMHVWKVCWNTGNQATPEFLEKMRGAKRLQRSISGGTEPWLCPSHPENWKLEHDSMLEVARRYAVDGLHFDYIRYSGPDYCYCDSCRERFQQSTGQAVEKWPADVTLFPPGRRREEWEKWCQGNINQLVRSVAEDARKIRPGIQISAAVFRNWDTDRHHVLQDWPLWCREGWLDMVCPMNYTACDSIFESSVKRQQELCGKAKLIPGIGATATGITLTADKVANQILITRQRQAAGFIIFDYNWAQATTLLPALRQGLTASPP